ncbi:DEK_C domain-containing protein, partial [Haematococcus lacustris]
MANKQEPTTQDEANTAAEATTPRRAQRERKQVQHYTPQETEKAEFIIKQGRGTKLGDIPNVRHKLSGLKGDDDLIASLHKLVYNRPGTVVKRKRNLYEFSGFSAEEEKNMDKIHERLSKWSVGQLHAALDAFDMPRGTGEDGKKV